ncbi:hypothetical protein [Rufibacter hautae]|uniref:Uncharacterized protein n=1 Tax=Rufibacter hautae TaxID=2595005 RepID=A0A5B6TMG2_9BACT|nr:hypothetical protein [Rufibacter hautae]KAA3440690.1 hypothetical protein FOA19_08590 [Rufibacter hautae]
MAEINIEPKKRSSWAWIIVLLILLVVGYLLYKYFFEAQGGNPETTGAPTSGMIMSLVPGFVSI